MVYYLIIGLLVSIYTVNFFSSKDETRDALDISIRNYIESHPEIDEKKKEYFENMSFGHFMVLLGIISLVAWPLIVIMFIQSKKQK